MNQPSESVNNRYPSMNPCSSNENKYVFLHGKSTNYMSLLPARLIAACLLIALPAFLIAQSNLTVTPANNPGITPLQLVQDYLIGQGVTISNVTFNGSSDTIESPQAGYFSAATTAASSLGMSLGVITSSGMVEDVPATGSAFSGSILNQPGDPDLTNICGVETNDAAVIEFDFIPQSDKISFRYVFASEEFYEFCTQFNDPFGFFLSGPGIEGPYTNNSVNIALMPGSAFAVTIFNLCADPSSNWCNKPDPFTPYQVCREEPGPDFVFDGLTFVFTARYNVIPCTTYHIKLAVADALDGNYDSGVFLEKNSFSSNVVATSTTYTPNVGPYAVKGCNDAVVQFALPQPEPNQVTVHFEILGTAVMGVDYSPIPDSVIIPVGMTSANLTIHPLPDGIPFEPDKSVILRVTTNTCSGPIISETIVTIKDNNPLSATMTGFLSCQGQPQTLTPVVLGGQTLYPVPTYHFLWNTGDTTSSLTVSPPAGHHVYSVTVTDACGISVIASATVDVGTTPGPAGPVTCSLPVICTSVAGVVFSVPAIAGADSYVWTFPAGATVTSGANTNSVTVSFSASASPGQVTVFGRSTFCGDGSPSSMTPVIHPSPGAAGPVAGVTSLCQGPVPLTWSIAPVANATTYEWTVPPGATIVSGTTSNAITCIFPIGSSSGVFTVRGDNAECPAGATSSLAVTVNPLPGDAGAISGAAGSEVCQGQAGLVYSIHPVANASQYDWVFTGTGATLAPSGPSVTVGFSSAATSGVLTVTPRNGCGDGAASPAFPITVKVKPVAGFAACNTLTTVKNGRPVILKGGTPLGPGGVYSGPGVSQALPGVYVFDPADPAVTGSPAGSDHAITFRYTHSDGCFDELSRTMRVFSSNAADPCPGTLQDRRDGKNYPTLIVGSGATARCWMAANLDHGTLRVGSTRMTDDCTFEKYCPGDNPAACASTGGFYQWDELVEYREEEGMFQDLCPPGWHVATPAEWDLLIAANLGEGIAGAYLKDLKNASGFLARLYGIFYLNNQWAFTPGTMPGTMFWTSAGRPGGEAVARGLNDPNPSVSLYEAGRANAFSARCVRN